MIRNQEEDEKENSRLGNQQGKGPKGRGTSSRARMGNGGHCGEGLPIGRGQTSQDVDK